MSTKGITDEDKRADAKAYYADIFSLPHWEPASTRPSGLLSHPRMPLLSRAAMFASFDALVGYRETVSETVRTADGRMELSDGELEELDRRLRAIIDKMKKGTDNGEIPTQIIKSADGAAPAVSITYFVPDAAKDGGSYVTVTGEIRKIDLYQRLLFFSDGKAVNIDDVVKICLCQNKNTEISAAMRVF